MGPYNCTWRMQFRYASSTPDNITQRNGGSPIYPTYAKISILLVQFVHQFSLSVILIENILYLIKLLTFNTNVNQFCHFLHSTCNDYNVITWSCEVNFNFKFDLNCIWGLKFKGPIISHDRISVLNRCFRLKLSSKKDNYEHICIILFKGWNNVPISMQFNVLYFYNVYFHIYISVF